MTLESGVERIEHPLRVEALHGRRPDRVASKPCQGGSFRPLASNVSHHGDPFALFGVEQVVEIPADLVALARGSIPGGDLDAGDGRELGRQQALLKGPGEVREARVAFLKPHLDHLATGDVDGESPQCARLPRRVFGHVHEIAQPKLMSIRRDRSILDLLIQTGSESGLIKTHDSLAIVGMHSLGPEVRIRGPAAERVTQHVTGSLAHEREPQGFRITFPDDRIDALDKAAMSLRRLLCFLE